MVNPVTVADIEARWRPLSPAESTVAQSLIGDAWTVLQARVPNLEQRQADGTVTTSVLTLVVSAMVLRVLKNPDGKRQETIDDYSWTRDNAVSAGLLYVADDELALLLPVAVSGDAFTVRPFGQPGYRAGVDLDWS